MNKYLNKMKEKLVKKVADKDTLKLQALKKINEKRK